MQDSSRQHSQWRLWGIVTLFFALLFSNLTVWAQTDAQSKAPTAANDAIKVDAAVSFAPSTRIKLFTPGTGQWNSAIFSQAKVGNEFTYENKLYRIVEPGKARIIRDVDIKKLPEADQPFDKTFYQRPAAGDVVQVLGKDNRFTAHEKLSAVQSGARIRFQGRAYDIAADRSLTDTGITFSTSAAVTGTTQPIEITRSAWQHIMDRHTIGGSKSAGTTLFIQGTDIRTLIKNAEPVTPTLESNGYLKRELDSGYNIGFDPRSGRKTSYYRVISTQSGKLVTAYPVVRR